MTADSPPEIPRSQDAATDAVRALLLPILETLDLELFELDRQGARIRIAIDRRSYQGPGTGITIEELSRVTRELNAQLELEDVLGFAHELEVSSPGVERELRRAADWQRHRGELVRVVLQDDADGVGRVIDGRIESVGDAHVVLQVDEETREIRLDAVQRAKTRFEMPGQKTKRSGRRKAKSAETSKE